MRQLVDLTTITGQEEEEQSPASLATSKSKLPLNIDIISEGLADNEDYKTTTSNHNATNRRILIRTILKTKKKRTAMGRTGRRINKNDPDTGMALDRHDTHNSHPDKGQYNTKKSGQEKMTKVKIYRRKASQQEQPQQIPMRVHKEQQKEQTVKKRQKVLLKRKLEKSIQTEVELKTRPRTYTYFVTRKNGEGGSDEFVSSSTEVRDFTYSVTVSKTVYKTASQVMTSLVPTF